MQVLLVEMTLMWGVVVTSWCLPGSLSRWICSGETYYLCMILHTDLLTSHSVCVCLHNPKMPLRSISSNTRKGQFGVLRCHTSPSLPVLSSRVHRVPKLCPRTSCPPSHTHSLLSSLPLTLSPSALCVSPVSSFLKNGVSSGFTLAASRGIHGNKPVHGER